MALIVTKQLVVKHTEIPIDPHAADQSIGSRIDAAIVEALDEGNVMHSVEFQIDEDEWHRLAKAWHEDRHSRPTKVKAR